MKKLLIISIVFVVAGCCDCPEGVTNGQENFEYVDIYGDTVQVKNFAPALSTHLSDVSRIAYHIFQNVNQHGISFREGIDLITEYNKVQNLDFGKYGIGGCVPKSIIDELPTHEPDLASGLIYFICFDEKVAENPDDDEIYLAYRGIANFDYSDYYPQTYLTNSHMFYLSNNIHKKSWTDTELRSMDAVRMKTYLTGQVDFVDQTKDSIPYSRVKDLNSAYILKFKSKCKDPLNAGGSVDCTESAHGFFEKTALEKMFAQASPNPILALRYYFGLDNTLGKNKIRVVLMGATSDANLLHVTNSPGIYVYANYVERSWP